MANGKIIYYPTTFRSLSLNGSSYADLASADFNTGTSNFAIDAIVYPATSAAASMTICSKVDATPIGYHFYVDPVNLRLVFEAKDSVNSLSAVTANGSLTANAWHWVRAAVDRAGLITLYIDGVAAGSTIIVAYSAYTWSNAANFLVGDAFTGKIGMLRFDMGRLLPAGWIAAEYNRLAYGYPRTAQDFQAVWTFGDSLVDLSSDAYTLTHSATASYTTGWPTGPLTYTFDFNFIVGHSAGYMEADDIQRSLAGDLVLYRGPRKRTFTLEMSFCQDAQADVIRAIWASGYSFDFYEQADYPKTCSAVMVAPPDIVSQGSGYWQVALELAEI